MASGRVGAVKPAAATYKTLYKPTSAIAVVSVSICNQASTDDNIRLSVTQSASTDPTPATNEFISVCHRCCASKVNQFSRLV